MEELVNGRLSRGQTLADRTTEALRLQLCEGIYKPGERLPSGAELAKSFGVSPAVIREAMSRLKHDGLVETIQGAGCFVADTSSHRSFRLDLPKHGAAHSVVFIYQLREAIEGDAAKHAATHRTADDLKIMRRHLDDLDQAIKEKADATGILNHQFHRAILIATRNPLFLEFWDFLAYNVRASIAVARAHSAQFGGFAEQAQREHRAIYEGIRAGNPSAAQAAAIRHIRQSTKRLTLPDGQLARHIDPA